MKPLVDVVDIEGGYLHWGGEGGGLEFEVGNRGTIPARASVQHECSADEQACAAVSGSYPGSVRARFTDRKPQTHAYAPLAPVLHYNPGQGDLVGGNFWDMRATGRQLGNPVAEHAQGLPTNPVEMGLPDIACAVYRASHHEPEGDRAFLQHARRPAAPPRAATVALSRIKEPRGLYLFAGRTPDTPLSNMALLMTLGRMKSRGYYCAWVPIYVSGLGGRTDQLPQRGS